MISPTVSIVIPLYNKEKYIAETLRSVLTQTFSCFEVIIVDDGSTDNGVELIRKMNDRRIRIVIQDNSGVSVARNHGAQEAKGELLVFLDADDRWHSKFLEIMVKGFAEKCANWVMCAESHIADSNTLSCEQDTPTHPQFEKMNYFKLFLNNQTGCPGTILMRKEIFTESGGFIKGIKNGEDVEMWLRIALKYPDIYYCSQTLVLYMVYLPDSATAIKRSQHSLILFWEAMSDLYTKSNGNVNHDLFRRCFTLFANKAYRFYIRSGYYAAADHLFHLPNYRPNYIYYIINILPRRVSSLLLNSVNQIRHGHTR